nr:RHS repeat-associated core domain-containing protein [Aeoliella straminimaris]
MSINESAKPVVERYSYTPYGEVTVLNGHATYDPDGSTYAEWTADPDNQSDIDNEFLYTGRRLDPETGLQYSRYRYYHPQLGRWVTQDPIEYLGGFNLYEYVDGMPTFYEDPFGLYVHHPYPLYLGGSNDQLGIDLPMKNHQAAHKYFKDRGYGFGDAGRANWKKLNAAQQRRVIRGSLKAAGVKSSDIRKIMKSAFKGSKSGTKMPRGSGLGKNFIKGAVVSAIVTYPYDLYAATADDIEAFGVRVFSCEAYQILMEKARSEGNKSDSAEILQPDGSVIYVQIVPRVDPKDGGMRCYIIARRTYYDEEGNPQEMEWIVRDDKSCPATGCSARYSVKGGGWTCAPPVGE